MLKMFMTLGECNCFVWKKKKQWHISAFRWNNTLVDYRSADVTMKKNTSFGAKVQLISNKRVWHCEIMTHHFRSKLLWWLVGWVLWRINLCRLFNAKSIFMKIVWHQTIQFRISTQFKYHHHHHHVLPPARISLTLSRHFYLSFIASDWSSRLQPVSSHSCCMYVCMYVRAGRLAFARPYVWVHRSTSLISSSLLLQQCHACLGRLTWIVFVSGGRWPYSWYFAGCCLQDLFNIARSILVLLPSSFFSSRFVSVQELHPDSSLDTTAAWKKLRFILSVRSDFHMIDSLSIAFHVFVSRVSMFFSVDETLLPR